MSSRSSILIHLFVTYDSLCQSTVVVTEVSQSQKSIQSAFLVKLMFSINHSRSVMCQTLVFRLVLIGRKVWSQGDIMKAMPRKFSSWNSKLLVGFLMPSRDVDLVLLRCLCSPLLFIPLKPFVISFTCHGLSPCD